MNIQITNTSSFSNSEKDNQHKSTNQVYFLKCQFSDTCFKATGTALGSKEVHGFPSAIYSYSPK
jgi:hypothetical protein